MSEKRDKFVGKKKSIIKPVNHYLGNFLKGKHIKHSAHNGKGNISYQRIAEKVLHEKLFKTHIHFIDHAVVLSGSSIGFHNHVDSTEVYVVLSGKGKYRTENGTFKVESGDILLNNCSSHGLINNTEGELSILVFEVDALCVSRPEISVITVTNRPELIENAIKQVDKNNFPREEVEHLLILDGITIPKSLQKILEERDDIKVLKEQRLAGDTEFRFERLGRLRDLGCRVAKGKFLALLDDDNRWSKEHLSSLYNALIKDISVGAVYSWRHLYRNGRKYRIRKYPWVFGGDEERQKVLFNIQKEVGILTSGSSAVRDCHGFKFRGRLFSCVDAGEWMWQKAITDKIGFSDSWTYTELLYGFCDDYRFANKLLAHGIACSPTRQFTLEYELGGNSQC